MKKDKKLKIIIFSMLLVGILISIAVHFYIENSRKEYLMNKENSLYILKKDFYSNKESEEQNYFPKLENDILSDAGYMSFIRRFEEIDKTIEELKTDKNNIDKKDMPYIELKHWEKELSTLYNNILLRATDEEIKEIVKSEQEWIKEREILAKEEADKKAGTYMEKIEYISSQARSTRQRAFELLEKYRNILDR